MVRLVRTALSFLFAANVAVVDANTCSARGGCDCDCSWASAYTCGHDDGSCCFGCCCGGPSPTPPPGPPPSPGPGGWQPCSSGPCCNPYSVVPQYCPGGVACQECGGGSACQCQSTPSPSPPSPPYTPSPTYPPSPPSPTSPPSPGGRPPADGCFRGRGEWGVPITSQKNFAASHWQYQWGPAPYGTPGDQVGVLQIVNGGSETMWIRYAGKGIGPGQQHDWRPYITQPSALNGNKGHKWNALNSNGMVGQGDGFKLEPGEYQIVPFSSSACWAGATLGCGSNGENCKVSPNGRGGGTDASATGQPNTLFEWTAPGVWDASLVDGFGMPVKIEVDGCGPPFSGSTSDCGGSGAETYLQLEPSKCTNRIFTPGGQYVGCASMCACQNAAQQMHMDTSPMCPGMASVSSIVNQPYPPGGYCGCPQGECVQWLRGLFGRDAAGKCYCDSITDMTRGADGKRAVYCQAYDDEAGTRSYGNGVLKVVFCNKGFEWATSHMRNTSVVV
eukprot:TRINITY_DN815_c0_g1_i1.p1 TRINITY_DN815_c0_g1~~TRINITY_DN815_c0_g1_i1.p1  ORF type:complete len:502 (+),score=39.35 TRINITY_DN815_c0_g1_i1:87-1592(+)